MDGRAASAKIFRFGLFEADANSATLMRNGVRVKIQDQPFRVLVLLLERPGEIVAREELRQRLWPEGTYVDFDGSLNVILKKLRAALDEDSENPRFIETVPRRGYRFIAPVSLDRKPEPVIVGPPQIATAAPLKEVRPETVSAPAPARAARPILPYVASAAVLVALISAGLIWYYRVPSSSHATAPVQVRRSVAVLGFHSLSGRAEDAWLATALSEMLSTELSGGEKLRLVSGEDVANLRIAGPWSQTDTLDQGTTARIGNALNSDTLVLGSYTIIGNPDRGQIRLDVRMQDARTGEILTEIAEIGSTQDLFRLVSRAGGKLRDRLGVPPLQDTDEAGILASLPLDPDAARFYALGISKLRQFDALAARDLLQQAAEADPKYSLGHAMLARAWGALGYEQKRREEAKKALDLSADLPRSERLLVQGDYYESIGDHEKAASTYRTLFELFPDSVEYGLQLATAQRLASHGSEGLATLARLRQLPPPASDDPNIDLVEARIAPIKADSLKLIRAALAKASAQGKKLVYAQGRHDECITLVYGEHPNDADVPCQEAYNTFLAAGNRLAAADTLRLMGDRQGASGHADEALATYNRAVAMLSSLGDHEKTGAVLNNMGSALMNDGKLDAAERLFKEAKLHFEEAGDRGNALIPVSNMADLFYLRGQLSAASRAYEQALQMMEGIDPADPSYLLYRLGDLQLSQGKLKDARQQVEKSIESMHGEAAEPMSSALLVSGELSEAEGNLPAARDAFNRSLQIRQTLGDLTLVAEAQFELADLAVLEKQPQLAENQIQQALAQFKKRNSGPDLVSGYTILSRALLMQDKRDEARKAVQSAIEASRGISDPALKMRTAMQAASIEMASNDSHAISLAHEQLRSTIAQAKKLGYRNIEMESRLVLGQFDLRTSAASGRTSLTVLASEARDQGLEFIARQAEQALTSTSNVVAQNQPGR